MPEGKCGAKKMEDGKCAAHAGSGKTQEGKCAANAAGMDKAIEGKGDEGKCGANKAPPADAMPE